MNRHTYRRKMLELLKSQIPEYWYATCEVCAVSERLKREPESPHYCGPCKAERKRRAA